MKKFLLLLGVLISIAIQATASDDSILQPPGPSEPDGTIGGHEYVDLGLPSGTLWATCNIGASSPYEKGDYFAWGEVEPRDAFPSESYKFFLGYGDGQGQNKQPVFENIGDDISGTEYDAARHQWGNGWRLPNEQDLRDLLMVCWSRGASEENGVYGMRIYGLNGHSIFLPFYGCGPEYGQENPFGNEFGAYWTGVEDDSNQKPMTSSYNAKSIRVELYGRHGRATTNKTCGLTIRAVVNPRESGIEDIYSDNENASIEYRSGNIHIVGNHSEGIIKIYDLSGRMIFSDNVADGVCKLPIISSGIYIVSFADNGNAVTTRKITIK